MRLLAVVEYYPPLLGHDLRIFELARRLPEDWEVHFLVLPSLRRLMEGDARTTEGIQDPRIAPEPVGLEPWIRALWRRTWIAPYLLSYHLLGLRMLRVARRIRPDVIVANYPSPYTGLLAYRTAWFLSVPFVADLCDDIVAYFATVFPKGGAQRLTRVARRVQDFLIRRSAVLPAVTESLKEYAVAAGVPTDRIEVLPNGVDTGLFRPRSDGPRREDRLRCFYGGSLESWAGSTLLLGMARLALDSDPSLEFVVAGDGWDRGGPLPPNVAYLGLLDKEGVAAALRSCDAVLVPLRPGTMADATSPVKLFEGLAAGRACVCSKSSGIEDIVRDGENGLLVDSEDPEAWLERLRRLARDPALLRRLGEGARASAPAYDWSALAARFDRLLRRATA